MYRKVWTIPDRVFDMLDGQPLEVEVEVVRAIRAYHRYFDENGQDDGFDVSSLSAKAQSVFWRVYDELHEANERYADKCAVNKQNALIGAEKRQKNLSRKEKKKIWYQEHKEKINQKRRKKPAQDVSSDFDSVSSGLSSDSVQSQADSHLQKKSANAPIGSNDLNNIPTLHSGILLEVGCGEKPSYPQKLVQNHLDYISQQTTATEAISNRTSGLSCSEAEQTERSSLFASKAVGQCGSERQYRQFGIKDRWQSGRAAVSAVSAVSAQPCRSGAVESSARNVGAASRVHLQSAPHRLRDGEVLITKDFKVDFNDPIFQPYFRADRFLRNALNNWLIKTKPGCSIEKKWIARQLVKFARRQGKEKVLMGVTEDE